MSGSGGVTRHLVSSSALALTTLLLYHRQLAAADEANETG